MKRVVLAVAVAASSLGWFVTRADSATPSYRLAIATTRSVSETLDEVGTVEPVAAASVAFPVAGKVASVQVTRGATVTRGQVLATLDTTALDDAVDAAQAALDQARLTLANALAANAEAASASAVENGDDSALEEAQRAVLDGQRLVDENIAAAQAALESANDVCAAVTEESVSACQAALDDVLRAQSETADAQSALSAAANALEEIRNRPAQPDRGVTSTASAEDLKHYQKEIDAAAAAVAVAKQNVAAATIVSPMNGIVEAVDVAVGDTVSAGPAAHSIRITGPGGYEVTAIVSVDDLEDVKVGQSAVVTPDGSSRRIRGEVVAIGAPRTTNGTTTYPVSIGVDDDSALRNGTVASVSITIGEAASGVAVPTSAVHVEGTRQTVTVVRDGEAEVVDVTVGMVGRTWTQITRGVKVGDRVVLADLNEPLPGDATSSNNGEGRRDRVFGGDGGPIVEFTPGGGGKGPVGVKIGP